MTYPCCKHHPFPTVSEAAESCSITLAAPSKTFNIAGIVASYAVIPEEHLRKEFYEYLEAREFNQGSIFSYTATTAAYTHGAEWRRQMLAYVMKNVDFVEEYLKKNIPQIKVCKPQASFLVWLDCRELGLDREERVALFTEQAHLALNEGAMFGTEGSGYMRINVGCPRSTLEKALEQLKSALHGGFYLRLK
jgi:cystathionine beta-lyase